jgi:cyclic beta-1,2-glucan synthetase
MPSVVNILNSITRLLPRNRGMASPWNSEDPIRAELFSIERLEEHAVSLATAQQVTTRPISRRSLAARLKDNESVLLAAYRDIAATVAAGSVITPAAEWLLDNYHLVEEQIREIRQDLPPSFYRLLPKLAAGPLRGHPRVFGLAWAFIAHTDSRFDPEALRCFLRAYQRIQPLTIGELWAVAITLRIVLVENLRRAAARIVSNRDARHEADSLADRLLGVSGLPGEPDIPLDPTQLGVDREPAFVVQLTQRMRDQDPQTTPALRWLDQRLSVAGQTSEQFVRDELQKQGASNVTVRNIITSMRLLSDLDWPEFFESVSLVDEQLRACGDFAAMDFASRNLYRSAIEEIARGSKRSELEVTQAAVRSTQEQGQVADSSDDGHRVEFDLDRRESDPGFHLIAAGRAAFEASLGYRASFWNWSRHFNVTKGAQRYIVAIALLGALVLGGPLSGLHARGVDGWPLLWLALLGFIPALDVAVALVNHAVTGGFGATILPGLSLRGGVPESLRTVIAVPALLSSQGAIETLLERLEVHHLASPDGEIYYALLTDWLDAPVERVAGDEELLQAAAAGIAQLNRRHAAGAAGPRFQLFHRRRIWSAGQRLWMGLERKRGKLHEFNRLLRGASDTTFIAATGGDLAAPTGVRYVITLDADTRLPRDSARRLVGKMAHPLNRPRFDSRTGRVIDGYAVLQPRVAPSLPTGREGSRFQRVFSSAGGIDPYAAAVSDVYQDLFGEGSYAGKGIYDIDAFEAALAGRVVDGALLSHDLFEGIFARAGLVSDIQVVEEFPSRYDVAAARQHRWARGDWQLLPWIFGRADVAAMAGTRGSARVPLIGLWKMLDNLRRSLTAPASVAALLAGWLLAPSAAALWTGFILATIALPAWLSVFAAILPNRAGITLRSHFYALRRDIRLAGAQSAFLLTFLAHQAWLMSDAIARTLFRLLISRSNLLQWVTAAQASLSSSLTLPSAYRRMVGAVVVAVTLAILVWTLNPVVGALAMPVVLLWLLSPAVAVWISNSPRVAGRVQVPDRDARILRQIGRQTWRYFETFVTVDDNMLPPDNIQEDPRPVIAHRTSPTNIGLYLLAAVSARDFGWAGTIETAERLEATLGTLQRLQLFRGHLYNWYDTRDLRPLDPRYVSTVDSGNLAAHLLTLASFCSEWKVLPAAAFAPFSAVTCAGVQDAVTLTREALLAIPADRHTQSVNRPHLDAALAALETALEVCEPVTITTAAATMLDMARGLASELADDAGVDMLYWAEATGRCLASARRDAALSTEAASGLTLRLAAIESTARSLAVAMEFGFLLDHQRRLLAIGYSAAAGVLDPNCYDLLASEARLASFVAIAKNDVPAQHWFRLGRAVTPIGSGAALISWSGSMFEYLMPSLVLRAPAGSLLDQTNRLIVRRQVGYGRELDVPWGISESAYNARDIELTYQYSNFGVPGLGLKRGLSENVVIAPYATALAAMVDPVTAVENLERLATLGGLGRHGYYEALDYTGSRLPEGARFAIVRAYMAHHQGMTLCAIANVLHDGRLRARFHAEPMVQATELLLQERTPRDVSVTHPRAEEVTSAARISDGLAPVVRRLHTPHDATPQTHLLSNGRYAVMVTAAGSGYSRWGDLAVTRWTEDATCDACGSYFFLRDAESGRVWSTGYQPSGVEADRYEVTFTEDRAEFVRSDGTLTTTLEVLVSPEDDAEVRRVSLTNSGNRVRDIDVTSYSELVLAPAAADLAHLTFSKMFVQTEFLDKPGALLATRRRRTPGEPEVWAAQYAVVEGESLRRPEYETDRARFLGRSRSLRDPLAVVDGRRLSNTVGTVLDPIFAMRHRVRVPAGGTVRIAVWTFLAASREGVLQQLDKHQDSSAFVRAGTLAWTQGQVQLRHLGIDAAEASLFQRLAGHALYASAAMRPASATISRGAAGPEALWAQGISGDLPIVLLRIDDMDDIDIARQLLRAQEYWRMKQLAVDLVILNERASSYIQDLQSALETQLRMSQSRPRLGGDHTRGAVFILRSDLITDQARTLLFSVARVVLSGQRGSLAAQLDRQLEPAGEAMPWPKPASILPLPPAIAAPAGLEFFNGLGGFAADGREYVTLLGPGQSTPAPWINVVANPQFGFLVSAEGGGYTWSRNSRENQLTPWSNDPISDRPGEVLYVRDDDTGELWGPTAAPIRDPEATYSARHGQGYSRFAVTARGIALDLLVYVPLADPVKISRLRIHNTSRQTRRLSMTAYAECVLGAARSVSAPHIITAVDAASGALLVRNPWGAISARRVVFADLRGQQNAWTCDRREFLGRHGTLARPAALVGPTSMSQRAGAGLDPCCALQTTVELEPDETTEIVFLLGESASIAETQVLIARYRSADLDEIFQQVLAYWDDALGKVQVKTPDRSLDLMLNRWLLYQTLACRVWARSGFYQASGAYGFRDQLQDGMALALSRPGLAREHLLRAAGRQFTEGDVQHWWLPHTGQGVRTRISDDRVWLAHATAQYVNVTGDRALLDETVAFLEGQALRPGEHDAYFQPVTSDDHASVYEHCARGLDQSLQVGRHGLPLIGTGDWNDGLNRVGELGRGESVWLGWFLYSTLNNFASLARARNEELRAARWLHHATALRSALESGGWDGQWYRRAYYDDGSVLGSASSEECRIDAIAQSWSVLSGAAAPERARLAMAAVSAQLIRAESRLALLFTPPFDQTRLDPGYIKGYPPGLRENGGQYTHAALWSVMAFAALGQGAEAGELLSLLNPVNRTATRADVHRYKVEPYVVAADVYSVAPHIGRGGWTWYTGSAGWMYRAGLESILGVRVQDTTLHLAPCLPPSWPRADVTLRHRSACYQIAIENPQRVSRGIVCLELDGALLAEGQEYCDLVDDGATHQLRVVLGTAKEKEGTVSAGGVAVPSSTKLQS